MGRELLRLYPEPQRGEKRSYRAKVMAQLGQGLCSENPIRTANTLWQARKLASRFDSWPELEKFAEGLSKWHVLFLLSVDPRKGNKSTMEELHKRCVKEHWSEGRLKREIQNDRGRKAGSGSRPNPRRPATAAIAVKDLYFAARRWKTYHDQCLTGRRPILKHARRAEYDRNLFRDVQNAIQGVEQVQEAVTDELQQLRQLAKNIKSALKE
jgi:hypothetical protein